jgi:hypothetical protein
MGRILLAVVLGCSSMVAQKMVLGDDRDRQVAVFAVDLSHDRDGLGSGIKLSRTR